MRQLTIIASIAVVALFFAVGNISADDAQPTSAPTTHAAVPTIQPAVSFDEIAKALNFSDEETHNIGFTEEQVGKIKELHEAVVSAGKSAPAPTSQPSVPFDKIAKDAGLTIGEINWFDPRLRNLDLTKQQIRQINNVRDLRDKALGDTDIQLHEIGDGLQETKQSGNSAKFQELMVKSGNLMERQSEIKEQYNDAMQTILTSDQNTKFQENKCAQDAKATTMACKEHLKNEMTKAGVALNNEQINQYAAIYVACIMVREKLAMLKPISASCKACWDEMHINGFTENLVKLQHERDQFIAKDTAIYEKFEVDKMNVLTDEQRSKWIMYVIFEKMPWTKCLISEHFSEEQITQIKKTCTTLAAQKGATEYNVTEKLRQTMQEIAH